MPEPIAYLKPLLEDDDPLRALADLPPEDAPVLTPFATDLLVAYLVDEGSHFTYVQGRDLPDHGGSAGSLHRRAVDELVRRADGNVTLHEAGPIQGLIFDGNLEASLLLVDDLWDDALTGYFTTAPVAAVPSRDVLAFCDRDSIEGIAALRAAVDRVWPNGDHLLSRSLYVRQGGVWTPFTR